MQVAVLTGLGAAPWVVKPLYGFISDTVPIFGYRRRSYLIICGILGEIACLWLQLVEPARQQQPAQLSRSFNVLSSSSAGCSMLFLIIA